MYKIRIGVFPLEPKDLSYWYQEFSVRAMYSGCQNIDVLTSKLNPKVYKHLSHSLAIV